MRFFACAVIASRRRAGRWSSPPAPRRARAPAASTPHAHDAASFRNFAAPARTDDRRTGDATSGPQEWLTAGRLHDGATGEYGAYAHRCGGPLSSRPLSPLPCNAAVPPKNDLLFNFSLGPSPCDPHRHTPSIEPIQNHIFSDQHRPSWSQQPAGESAIGPSRRYSVLRHVRMVVAATFAVVSVSTRRSP